MSRRATCIASAPTTRSSGKGTSTGTTAQARSCQPPSPPWQPTRPSKAATSSVPGSRQAVDVDVGCLGSVGDPLDEPGRVRTRTAAGGPRPRRGRRRVGATRAAQHDRAVVVHHDDEADAGVRGQAGDEPGKRSDSSRRVELLLLAAHVDQAEVAGPEDVEGLVPRRRASPCPWRPWSRASRRPHPARCGRPCPWRSRRTASCGRRRRRGEASSPTSARVRPQPSMSSSEDGDVALGEPGDERRQVLAVPVGERRALGLPVVGEDHEPVLPRCRAGHQLQLVEDAVDGLERLEALRAQDARVVGDLVVVDEVDVDRADALEHVLGDQDRVEVAQRAVGDAAQQGGLPVPFAAGLDVAADGTPGLEPVPGRARRPTARAPGSVRPVTSRTARPPAGPPRRRERAGSSSARPWGRHR